MRRRRPDGDRASADVQDVERELTRGTLELTPFVVILLLAAAIALIVLIVSGILLALQAFL